jgi:hypothetical protein
MFTTAFKTARQYTLPWDTPSPAGNHINHSSSTVYGVDQRFPNFFQVGTTFISQNVLQTPPTLVLFESKMFKILNYSVWYAIHVNFIFPVFFWTNVQSKRTTRAEPEDHLWSADHSLGNAGVDEQLLVTDARSELNYVPDGRTLLSGQWHHRLHEHQATT